jgi:low affinity Fe/Cu permease
MVGTGEGATTERAKAPVFERFARAAARGAGHGNAFLVAAGAVVAWLLAGPLFDFSDTWQLLINTATTIVTFLMVFLIQHTQNSDTVAMHVKLDEIIRVLKDADNQLLDLEDGDERAAEGLRQRYEELAREARNSR